jgi:ribonuclease HII
MRIRPNFDFERELWGRGVTAIAGVDEVGGGAFAGPVVAAAVILAPGTAIEGLADSKLLSPKRRAKLFAVIGACAVAIGIGRTDVEEVDRLNIYWAAMEARRRAVEALPTIPAHILVDGKRLIAGCRVPQTAVVDGDALSASIAAASIVAKVTRDSIMEQYAQVYPGYGFERHKGYGTADHIRALTSLRPLPLHRWSFKPVWRAGRPQPQLAFWNHSGRREQPRSGAPIEGWGAPQPENLTPVAKIDHNSSLQIKYRPWRCGPFR